MLTKIKNYKKFKEIFRIIRKKFWWKFCKDCLNCEEILEIVCKNVQEILQCAEIFDINISKRFDKTWEILIKLVFNWKTYFDGHSKNIFTNVK